LAAEVVGCHLRLRFVRRLCRCLCTARGALWKAEFDQQGRLTSPTGCDQTFTANTLCLDNVVVAHPILEGGDGIILDRAENIWVAANERNAIALISQQGAVFEVFRNPVNAAGLRNAADSSVGNTLALCSVDKYSSIRLTSLL
jgi:hypothetical protein